MPKHNRKLAKTNSLREKADGFRHTGQFAKALELYERHLKVTPDDYRAMLDKGSVLMSLERFEDAAQVYSRMVQIKPDETALSNLGASLIRLGRVNEAKVVLDYALEINPKNVHARINLGGVLQALGEHQQCLINALEAVSIDPTEPLAFNNLGSAFFELAKFSEAKHAFETATLLDPKNLDAHINLATIESMLGAPQASIAAHQKALSLLPPEAKQRAEAIRFYMSFEYLKQGMLPEGWDCYEGGFSNLVPVAGARHPRRQFAVPRWNGEILNGKTLLVWREQGLGDELLFATCLHELEALGGNVIVECDKRLVEPFTRSFPQYTVRDEAFLPDQGMQSPYKDFDLHVPLGSLMKYFRRDIKDFERSGAYIKTDSAKVAKFAERLAPYKEDYRLVGICWRSGKLDPVRNLGYTTLDEWGEVLQTPGFKFVNLQYGECEKELQQAEEKYGVEILRWPDLNLKDDLDDIFALMQCLDAVASVQTAVLVMAGSIGVPTVGVKAGGWTVFGLSESSWFSTSILEKDTANIERALGELYLREIKKSDLVKADQYKDSVLTDLSAILKEKLWTNKTLFELNATLSHAPSDFLQSVAPLIQGRILLENKDNIAPKAAAKTLSLISLAQLYSLNVDESIIAIEEAIKLDDRTRSILPGFLWKLTLSGEFQSSIQMAATYVDDLLLNRLRPTDLIKLSKVYFEGGDEEIANRLVQMAYELEPNLKDGYWPIIDALIGQSRWLDAYRLVESEMMYGRASYTFLNRYVRVFYELNGLESSLQFIHDVYRENPGSPPGAYSVLNLMHCSEGFLDCFPSYLEIEKRMGKFGHTSNLLRLCWEEIYSRQTESVLYERISSLPKSYQATAICFLGVLNTAIGELSRANKLFTVLEDLDRENLFITKILLANEMPQTIARRIILDYQKNPNISDVTTAVAFVRNRFSLDCSALISSDDVRLRRERPTFYRAVVSSYQ